MIKKLLCLLVAVVLCFSSAGCASTSFGEPRYEKYSLQFFGAFDTIIQVVGYAPSEKEFKKYGDYAQNRFLELHKLFDRFNNYENINNVKTINDNAGISPVKVDPLVIDVIELSKEWYDKTNGSMDIAMGSVLNIWHDYMDMYSGNAEGAELPEFSKLEKANKHTNIDNIIVNKEESTVYISDAEMCIDLGGVAKGYAAGVVADELYDMGFTSFLISAGGNVVAKDAPKDGVRAKWGIAIQNPFTVADSTAEQTTDVVFATHQSVVTSGDYQRFYMVGDQRVHHIIDPKTLMPANNYRSVSIITEDSGLADVFSTALFCMSPEEGKKFAKAHDLKVMWIYADGTVEVTDSLLPLLRDRGGATGAIEK